MKDPSFLTPPSADANRPNAESVVQSAVPMSLMTIPKPIMALAIPVPIILRFTIKNR